MDTTPDSDPVGCLFGLYLFAVIISLVTAGLAAAYLIPGG